MGRSDMELSQGSDVGPPPHPPGRSAGGAFKDKKEREGRGGGRMVRAAWFTPDWSPHTPPFIRNYNTITGLLFIIHWAARLGDNSSCSRDDES